MNWLKRPGITLAVTIALSLIFSQTTYASVNLGTLDQAAHASYIDPGTGSIILQVLIGALLAGVAMIGVYRMRVKTFLSNLFTRRRNENEGGDSEDSD